MGYWKNEARQRNRRAYELLSLGALLAPVYPTVIAFRYLLQESAVASVLVMIFGSVIAISSMAVIPEKVQEIHGRRLKKERSQQLDQVFDGKTGTGQGDTQSK